MKRVRRFFYIMILIMSFLYYHVNSVSAMESADDDPGRERLSGQVIDSLESQDSCDNKTVSMLSLSTGTNPYTGSSYTHNSVFSDCTIQYGIDVSKYQGSIDWEKVAADGIDFAFIRGGYRGYGTSGTISEDSYYEENMENAAAAGIDTGVYFFSQAITVAEAEEEADYVIGLLAGYNITMPVVIDFEYAFVDGTSGGRLYNANLTVSQATKICQTFCNKIQSSGYTPMIYGNKNMLENHLDAAALSQDYKIWIAKYTTETDYSGSYECWQYSSSGKVDGISGNTDCNFWYEPDSDGNSSSDDSSTDSSSGESTVEGSDQSVTADPGIISQRVTGLIKETATAASITISWNELTSIDGYEIYRASAYSGTYSKVKTITDSTVIQLKQTGLTSAREYYYKVRGYKTIDGIKYYSIFSAKLSAYTKASYTRKAVTKAALKIRKTASSSAAQVVSVAKRVTLSVVSFTYDTSGNIWYHVSYTKSSKTYSGYLKGTNLTIYKYGKTTAKVNIRSDAGMSYKTVISVAKSVRLTVLSSKKASNGVLWYRVSYTKGKTAYKGYVSSNYVKLV